MNERIEGPEPLRYLVTGDEPFVTDNYLEACERAAKTEGEVQALEPTPFCPVCFTRGEGAQYTIISANVHPRVVEYFNTKHPDLHLRPDCCLCEECDEALADKLVEALRSLIVDQPDFEKTQDRIEDAALKVIKTEDIDEPSGSVNDITAEFDGEIWVEGVRKKATDISRDWRMDHAGPWDVAMLRPVRESYVSIGVGQVVYLHGAYYTVTRSWDDGGRSVEKIDLGRISFDDPIPTLDQYTDLGTEDAHRVIQVADAHLPVANLSTGMKVRLRASLKTMRSAHEAEGTGVVETVFEVTRWDRVGNHLKIYLRRAH